MYIYVVHTMYVRSFCGCTKKRKWTEWKWRYSTLQFWKKFIHAQINKIVDKYEKNSKQQKEMKINKRNKLACASDWIEWI